MLVRGDTSLSLIGAFIIVLGLYSVVWGKSKDVPLNSEEASTCCEKDKPYELPVINCDKKSTIVEYDETDHHVPAAAIKFIKVPVKNDVSSQAP